MFFLAYTNATAFSPADTFPLTIRAKLLMMAEILHFANHDSTGSVASGWNTELASHHWKPRVGRIWPILSVYGAADGFATKTRSALKF